MKNYQIKPETKVKLSKWDPNDTGDFKGGKEEGLAKLEKLNGKLEALQELLFAEHKHKVLVVLQAMDTGGKDGAILALVFLLVTGRARHALRPASEGPLR